MQDPQTALSFHKYLSSIDISDWNPQTIPVTAWGESLKDHSIPPHVKMMQALLENGCFHPFEETRVASGGGGAAGGAGRAARGGGGGRRGGGGGRGGGRGGGGGGRPRAGS